MSEEQKQNIIEDDSDSDGSDVDQIENLEAGNGMPISPPNYEVRPSNDLSVNRDEDLQHYVTEGTEVQASDVLTIEELPEESFFEQDSDERLESKILYEFPTDFDEENYSHLPQTYFYNANSCHSHELPLISSLNKIYSPSENHRQQKDNPFTEPDQKRPNRAIPENADGNLKLVSSIGSKKKVKEIQKNMSSIPTSQHNRCEVVQHSFPTIYEFTCVEQKCTVQPDDMEQKFKYPEYGSDEFADIENNLSDSSDNCDPNYEEETKPRFRDIFLDVIPKQEGTSRIVDGSKAIKMIPIEYSSSSENNFPMDDLDDKNIPSTSKERCQPSCSNFLPNNTKRTKPKSPVKTPFDMKMKMKTPMATILELPEFEDNVPPRQKKASSLKMKPIVGKRKDKCNVCNVRLGLCAIKCRCGGYYCAKHRYDKEHNCTFDYKKMGADEIRRNNPKVIAEKVRKL